MKYKGSLFGQIGRSRKYFDTGRTSEEWDAMEEWIKQAAPLLVTAACIAADARRLDEVEGIRGVVESCPVEFMPLPHAGKNCDHPNCPAGGDGPCAHCESQMVSGEPHS